jgi:hypothetical protein
VVGPVGTVVRAVALGTDVFAAGALVLVADDATRPQVRAA